VESPSDEKFARIKKRVAIVAPVFNDWKSLAQLCLALDVNASGCKIDITILAVNDGSSDSLEELQVITEKLTQISWLEIIHLACNLGHQRAIAVGLADVFARGPFDSVIVMDADGEESPKDIRRLLAEC
jgi:polyisoprenyl-phosphate glycosyltransferase